MMSGWGGSYLAVVLLLAPAATRAQDTAATTARPVALSPLRFQSFARDDRMILRTGDSTVEVGRRSVRATDSEYAGTPAWLLVETRSGAVPAAESLYLSRDLRPLYWGSNQGAARLAIVFARDSIFGATSGPAGKQNLVVAGRPDLVVSATMLEALFRAIEFTSERTDSVTLLQVDHVTHAMIPAQLVVIGRDSVPADPIGGAAASHRIAWIVALRAGHQGALFWVDADSGALLRYQQPLTMPGAPVLEYLPVPIDTAATPVTPPSPPNR